MVLLRGCANSIMTNCSPTLNEIIIIISYIMLYNLPNCIIAALIDLVARSLCNIIIVAQPLLLVVCIQWNCALFQTPLG